MSYTYKKLLTEIPDETHADVLLDVVRNKIREGSTVISDCWSSYNMVRNAVGPRIKFEH